MHASGVRPSDVPTPMRRNRRLFRRQGTGRVSMSNFVETQHESGRHPGKHESVGDAIQVSPAVYGWVWLPPLGECRRHGRPYGTRTLQQDTAPALKSGAIVCRAYGALIFPLAKTFWCERPSVLSAEANEDAVPLALACAGRPGCSGALMSEPTDSRPRRGGLRFQPRTERSGVLGRLA
jgi:hypothetical protein